MARGTCVAPPVVHVHAAFTMAWVLIFIAQPLLVRWGRLGWHRRVGYAALPLAAGVAMTMIPAGVFQATQDAAVVGGETSIASGIGVATSGLMFVALVAAGIWLAGTETHIRGG